MAETTATDQGWGDVTWVEPRLTYEGDIGQIVLNGNKHSPNQSDPGENAGKPPGLM